MNDVEHLHWAKTILAFLVERIRKFEGGDKFITYGSLAKAVDYPGPHTGNLFGSNIGKTLGVMGHLFDNLIVDGQPVPLIQALAVGAGKKFPSDGLKEFDDVYPLLSDDKKKDFVLGEYQRICRFGSRWEKVLESLNIESSKESGTIDTATTKGLYNPYGSEGSPEHRALRDYISENPSVINLSSRFNGVTEYPLKSGDSVDVVFEGTQSVTAVEVKSERSGNDDIERGLFQCIKYAAVLKAENKTRNKNLDVKCVLALGHSLPNRLRKVRDVLGITVYENIRYAD